MSNISSVRLLAAVSISALLCGCAGARLYSESRDKQGIAAKAAWEHVDLTKMVNEDRENLRKVLQAQLDTQDKVSAAIRNFTLSAMLEDETVAKGIQARVDEALRKLVGSNATQKMADSRKAHEALLAAQLKREVHASTFGLNGLAVPDCDSIKIKDTAPQPVVDFINNADARRQAAVIGAIEGLREACLVQDTTYAGLGERIGASVARAAADKAELERTRGASAALRQEYLAAKLAHEQAIKSAAAPPETADKVAKAVERLGKAVDALEKADDAFSIQLLSKERLESLDQFVTTVTQSAADGKVPEGAGQAATAFILLPKLVDDARASLAAAKMPLAMPLLIRRNIEQLKLEGATREIALLETRVQLSMAIADAQYQQAVQLWRASTKLNTAGMAAVRTMPVATAFSSASRDQKEQLYHATAQYLDAINRLEAKWRKLEYQRIATFHEVALSYAEINLKQWSSLIGSAVDQVAESAASGIKSEDVTSLINSLGILWIGNGVNK